MTRWRWLLLAGAATMIGASWTLSSNSVPADKAKESRFLSAWSPKLVFEPFQASCRAETLSSSEAIAGSLDPLGPDQNVHFKRTVEPKLCSGNGALLTLLNQSILSGLGSAGCQVRSDQLSGDHGIVIAYRCGGRTFGSVTVTPPMMPSGENGGRYSLTLRIDEQWAVRTTPRKI